MRPNKDISNVIIQPLVDDELPEDPRERFRYQLAKLMRPHMGQCITPDLLNTVYSQVRSLCLAYRALNIFPQELWDLDQEVCTYWNKFGVYLNIPIWIFRWLETGEIMTVEDVKTYLRASIESDAIIKRWMNMEPWHIEGEQE